jgi:hypothetical protein
LYTNILAVLIGRKTWVSYQGLHSAAFLPKLRQGVVWASGPWTETTFEADVNHVYAKEYEVGKDLQLLINYIRGRKQ